MEDRTLVVPAEGGTSLEDREAQARRELLRRIGVLGAATAPMLLGALKAERAIAQTIIVEP